jgi:hypothetical protein
MCGPPPYCQLVEMGLSTPHDKKIGIYTSSDFILCLIVWSLLLESCKVTAGTGHTLRVAHVDCCHRPPVPTTPSSTSSAFPTSHHLRGPACPHTPTLSTIMVASHPSRPPSPPPSPLLWLTGRWCPNKPETLNQPLLTAFLNHRWATIPLSSAPPLTPLLPPDHTPLPNPKT